MKVSRGKIVYLHSSAYAENVIGSGNVQGGNRPLLVVSNDAGNKHSNICIVVPLTRKNKPHLPTHFKIAATNSTALCEQLFTINQNDIERVVGIVSRKEMLEIDKCLKISLGLERG